jgi:GAF domain-containing protein
VHGALWVTAAAPDAFTSEHQELLDGVADLVAVAVTQEAMRRTEAVRRERIDSLDRLLHTVAESLDVRKVFADVSDVVRPGLPHDVLALTAWGEDGLSFRVYALAGVSVTEPEFWAPMVLAEADRSLLHRDPYLVHDVDAELPADTNRGRMFRRLGMRSVLRVPLPLGSDVFGSLFTVNRPLRRRRHRLRQACRGPPRAGPLTPAARRGDST